MDQKEREALRKLVAETIAEAGEIDPSELPHRVKSKLVGRAIGERNLDKAIADAIAEIERREKR
ncbi:MAG: hypothetical protein ACFB00_12920 [Parvularculaceae bacterium]